MKYQFGQLKIINVLNIQTNRTSVNAVTITIHEITPGRELQGVKWCYTTHAQTTLTDNLSINHKSNCDISVYKTARNMIS